MANRGLFGIGWLDFSSAKERKRREKAYFAKVFKFGQEQKEWQDEIVPEIFSEAKKADLPFIKYSIITRVEIIMNSRLDEEDDDYMPLSAGEKDWMSKCGKMILDKNTIPRVCAMAELICDANTFEELPTVEQVNERATKI